MSTANQHPISRGDRWGLIAFSLAGFAIAVWSTVFVVNRIIELTRGVDVPVNVEFVDTVANVPLADGGDTVPIELDQGRLVVPELTPIGIVPGVLGQIVLLVTIFTVVGCLLLLSRSILRGQVFSRRNSRLVATASLVGLVGFSAIRFFDNMLANAAVNLATDNELDTWVISVEPFTYVLAAFVLAVIMTTFTVGDRLQREKNALEKETEGLV